MIFCLTTLNLLHLWHIVFAVQLITHIVFDHACPVSARSSFRVTFLLLLTTSRDRLSSTCVLGMLFSACSGGFLYSPRTLSLFVCPSMIWFPLPPRIITCFCVLQFIMITVVIFFLFYRLLLFHRLAFSYCCVMQSPVLVKRILCTFIYSRQKYGIRTKYTAFDQRLDKKIWHEIKTLKYDNKNLES